MWGRFLELVMIFVYLLLADSNCDVHNWWSELSREDRDILHCECPLHLFSVLEGWKTYLTTFCFMLKRWKMRMLNAFLQSTEMLFLADLCCFAGSKTSSAGKNQEESSGAAWHWKGWTIKGKLRFFQVVSTLKIFSSTNLISLCYQVILI